MGFCVICICSAYVAFSILIGLSINTVYSLLYVNIEIGIYNHNFLFLAFPNLSLKAFHGIRALGFQKKKWRAKINRQWPRRKVHCLQQQRDQSFRLRSTMQFQWSLMSIISWFGESKFSRQWKATSFLDFSPESPLLQFSFSLRQTKRSELSILDSVIGSSNINYLSLGCSHRWVKVCCLEWSTAIQALRSGVRSRFILLLKFEPKSLNSSLNWREQRRMISPWTSIYWRLEIW